MKHDWRYAPDTILTLHFGYQSVVRYVTHPADPKRDGRRIPIVSHMVALEMVPANGRSRFVGVDEAKINSELRMIVRGGFINPANELANERIWKPCKTE